MKKYLFIVLLIIDFLFGKIIIDIKIDNKTPKYIISEDLIVKADLYILSNTKNNKKMAG